MLRQPKDMGREFPSVIDRAFEQAKKNRLVKEIMSADVATISPNASMYEAAKIMGGKHIGSLVVMESGRPVGIVTERDLLSKVLALEMSPKEVRVREVMSSPLVTIGPATTIREAARTMISKKGRLVVYEDDKVVGIITASDLIRSLPEVPQTQLKVDDFMTRRIVTVDEKTNVSAVAKMMGEKRIGSVVVTRKGEPIGIFTERDLLTALLAGEKPLSVDVGEVSSSPLVTLQTGSSVHEAAYVMASRHIRRLPIMADSTLIGIITARDLVEAYGK